MSISSRTALGYPSMDEVVGVIGLGAMGGPMAANLERAGYRVAGYDVRGHGSAGSVEEVAERATRAVLVIVRTRPQVEEVVSRLRRPGLDVVVMSTIDPTTMERLGSDLAARGLTAVDAPISGGVAGAEAGTLTIMASGDPAAVERCRPLFQAMGSHLFVIGERVGLGQAVKLANQLMLAAHMVACGEAVRMVSDYGLAPEQVLPVIERSTGGSWVAANWRTVEGWWREGGSGGSLGIIHKDLRTLLGDAGERGVPLPLTALSFQELLRPGR
ncbi:MAG TPA: NAD(P)-dependent oxidoreductase [Candidatus Dormibacteraeota bacterium]|nr:NAD(P)-dependent oxidoreductase [Candidatus Dormibacteraeota bacterium]